MNNIIILFIIIISIYLFINNNEIFKEKIDYIYSHEGNKTVKILSCIIIILLLFIIYYIGYYIENNFKINKFIIITLIIIIIIIFIEYKLSSNLRYSSIESNLDDVLSKTTTGDFILFRSYHSYDIPELFFYRYCNAIFSDIFFGHIAMIIKINNIAYILECTEDYYYCEYSKCKKNGVIFIKAYDKIKNYYGRVYLSRNNLEKYINNNYIYKFLDKYKNYSFLENNITCITLFLNFFNELNILKKKYNFILPYYFTKKNIYKINYNNIENIKIKNDYIINS